MLQPGHQQGVAGTEPAPHGCARPGSGPWAGKSDRYLIPPTGDYLLRNGFRFGPPSGSIAETVAAPGGNDHGCQAAGGSPGRRQSC